MPVTPPAPEPFQGMEEGDIIQMLNEYITSDPSGQRNLNDDDDEEVDDEEVDDEEVNEDGETTDSEEVPFSEGSKSNNPPLASSRVFLGTVGFVMLLILLGKK